MHYTLCTCYNNETMNKITMKSDTVVSFTDLLILFETVKSKINDDNLASQLKKCYYDKIVHQVTIEQIEQLNNQAVKIIIKIIQVL